MRKSLITNGLLVLVSVAVTFAGLELLFRFTDAEERLFPSCGISENALRVYHRLDAPHALSTFFVNEESSTVTYKYPDDPRGYFGNRNTVESRINSRGFRGPDFERSKGIGVFRVAFLGDSFTLGQGVKFEDTYPLLVSADLNGRHPLSGVRFESYNFGVGGGNLINSFNILDLFVFDTLPDMVVLGLTLNDVEQTLFFVKKTGGGLTSERNPRALDWVEGAGTIRNPGIIGRIATYRILSRAVITTWMSAKTTEYYRALYGQENSDWLELNLWALEKIAERCFERGIPFRVLILPVFYRLDAYPFEDIHAFFHRYLEARGIRYVDLLESFRGMRHEDLWVHRVDPHPNEKAHAVIARVAVEKVIGPALPRRWLAP